MWSMPGRAYRAVCAWIEVRFFPLVTEYMAAVPTITLTLALGIALLIARDAVVFVLLANSYLNTMSVGVSSMLTRREGEHHEAHQTALESHGDTLATLHQRHDEHADALAELREFFTQRLAAIEARLPSAEDMARADPAPPKSRPHPKGQPDL